MTGPHELFAYKVPRSILHNLPFLHQRRLLFPEIHLKLPAIFVIDDGRNCRIHESAVMQVDFDVVAGPVQMIFRLFRGHGIGNVRRILSAVHHLYL